MQHFNLSRYMRVVTAASLSVVAVLGVWQGFGAVLSASGGALVGTVALVMLTFSCSAYARAGMALAEGGAAPAGRLVRGGLLLSRMLLVMVLIAGFVSWRGFVPWAFVVGVLVSQISLVVSVVTPGHTGPSQSTVQEKSS